MQGSKSSIQKAKYFRLQTIVSKGLFAGLSIAILQATPLMMQVSLAEEEARQLKGKVVDADGHPVGGAKIVLRIEDTQEEVNGRSNGKGNFAIEHPQCRTLSFDVYPPAKSELTSAHYARVSGDLSKHFIVQLHKGFRVTGKVLAEGQGVKGLEIKVIGNEPGSHATVHGGGVTHTKGNGEYLFILTPGKKIFQIKNEVYSNLAPVYQHEFTITGDTTLPDMNLPLSTK